MINVLAQDNNIIPYRKELNEITGGVTASILLVQILYWWNKSEGGFYKFKEPCTHSLYVKGDSWCEELGYTRKQFDGAFKKLEEREFVFKKTTMERLTFYGVNHTVLSKALNGIYVKPERELTKSTKGALDLYTENTTENTQQDNDLLVFFEKLWKFYGRLGNKQTALQRFKKLSVKQREEVRAKVRRYVENTNTDGTYPSRKHLSTYLNKEKEYWNDEVVVTGSKDEPVAMPKNSGIFANI